MSGATMIGRPRRFEAIPGVHVGHAEAADRASGVTVVRFERASPAVVDIRGGASATYDTGSLGLDATFGRRWAIFLSGGSLFGLDAARGVRTRLLELGAGRPVFGHRHRIVPIAGASLFDLPPDRGTLPDYAPLGYAATKASEAGRPREGRVGAGAGASLGKYLGRARASPGGLASAAARLVDGSSVGVLVVVNAVGAVRDARRGRWISGARGRGGRLVPPAAPPGARGMAQHTTLAVAVTDLKVDRPTLQRVATYVATALGRVIVPFHTSVDGDVVFAVSTERRRPRRERRPGELADRLGWAAGELAERAAEGAARRARRSHEPKPGRPRARPSRTGTARPAGRRGRREGRRP